MPNVPQHDTQRLFRKYSSMDLRNVLWCKPYHVGNRYAAHTEVYNMAGFQCNFLHMSKLDGLVLSDKSRMDRMVTVNINSLVVFLLPSLELNGTIQMDFRFHQVCSCILADGWKLHILLPHRKYHQHMDQHISNLHTLCSKDTQSERNIRAYMPAGCLCNLFKFQSNMHGLLPYNKLFIFLNCHA